LGGSDFGSFDFKYLSVYNIVSGFWLRFLFFEFFVGVFVLFCCFWVFLLFFTIFVFLNFRWKSRAVRVLYIQTVFLFYF